MNEDYNRGFTNGLSVGLALNGKIIQPAAISNIWKYAKDKVTLSNISLADSAAVSIDEPDGYGPSDSIVLTNLSLLDSCSVAFY